MTLREELEALRNDHKGVDHLVYGDLSTNMVLFACAKDERGQEDHDRLVAQGAKILVAATNCLGSFSSGEGPGAQVVLGDPSGSTLIVRNDASSDEALLMTLSRGAEIAEVGAAAARVLARILADEG